MDESYTPDLLDNCAIEAPDNECIGVMRFHDEHDFLMFVPTNMNKKDIIKFSVEETEFMKNSEKSGRAGAAGGVVDIDTDSHSISSGIKKDTMIFVPRPQGVGVSIIYENKFDEVHAVNSIYNDIYMQSLKKGQKHNQIKLSMSYRHILICEMITRMKTYAIAYELGMMDISKNPFEGFNNLFSEMKTSIDLFMVEHSYFHAILLSWAATTGEMRNH